MVAFNTENKGICSLQICLKSSRLYLITLSFIALGATLSIFCANLALSCKWVLAAIILSYSGWIIWTEILLKDQRSIVRLVYNDDNTWQVIARGGQAYLALLADDSAVMGGFCVLRFKQSRWWKKSCVIFKDGTDDNTYRRLLVVLRSKGRR
jgi:hypothetical protein